jgi:hypothetical protein
MPQMIAAPTFQLPQLQAFSGGAQYTEAAANLADQLLKAYLKKQELNKGEAASSELADLLAVMDVSQNPSISAGPVQDPSAYAAPSQADQYDFLAKGLLGSKLTQNKEMGQEMLIQALLKEPPELTREEKIGDVLQGVATTKQVPAFGPLADPEQAFSATGTTEFPLSPAEQTKADYDAVRAAGLQDMTLAQKRAEMEITRDLEPKKPQPDRTHKSFRDGQTWEETQNWDPTQNAWITDEKSARPVDDEAYRLDLIGNITTNQLLPQQTLIPDDATAEERTMITAADSYHNLTEKIKLLTNHPEHGNLLKMDEVKDLKEEKEAARLIFQGPTAEEQLALDVKREEALSLVSPQTVPVSEEKLAQEIKLKQTPVLGPGERFRKDPTTGEVTDEIELVPGSANWRKRNASRQKALRAYKEFDAKTENNLARIDRVVDFYDESWLAQKGLLGVGAIIPASMWKEISNEIMSLRGVIGFDQLQAMREVSPTGGALGQVSTFELDNLQAILGRLDPKDPAGLVRNLRQIRDIYSGMTGNLRDAYNKDYGLLGDEYMIKEPEAKGKDTILRWDPKLDDGKGSVVEEER